MSATLARSPKACHRSVGMKHALHTPLAMRIDRLFMQYGTRLLILAAVLLTLALILMALQTDWAPLIHKEHQLVSSM